MIQFNLLPDVKLEYVKAQRTKALLTFISVVVSLAALAVLLLSFVYVNVVQKKSLRDEDSDISRYSTQLKSVPDLNKILTVQNQLNTLTQLHNEKPVASRLFSYLTQVTPAQASLNQLNLDFTANTLSVSGTAPSLDVVSTYTDTLKATKYKVSGTDGSKAAFSSVVLASFGRSDTGATFTITFSFDPVLFNSADDVSLVVPQTSTADQSQIFGGSN